MKQVTANVYVETGYPLCNVGFVTTREGILMIDTPMFPNDALNWRGQISKKGQVSYLINSDQHPDHFQGNHFFTGIVIAHQTAREMMRMYPADEAIMWVKSMDPKALPLMEGYQVRLPDITFSESLSLYLGDHNFELIHLPGHAAGVIGVYIPNERAVFASDCVCCRCKSFLREAVPDQWLESLKTLGELDVDIIIPGHGDVCNKEYLEEQANIIEQWVKMAESAIRQGLKEEEAVAKIPSPDPYPFSHPEFTKTSEPELNRATIARLYQVLGAKEL